MGNVAPPALPTRWTSARLIVRAFFLGRLRKLNEANRRDVVLGAFTVAVVSLFIGVVGSQMTQMKLDAARDRALDQSQLGVLANLQHDDFVPPYSASKLDDLNARVAPLVERLLGRDSGLVRVNIIALDGTILFSSNASVRGKVLPPAEKTELAEALSGNVGSSAHAALRTEENADLHAQFEDVLEVYVPIALEGRVVGAYEIYQDNRATQRVLIVMWLAMLVACIAPLRFVAHRPRAKSEAPRRAPAQRRGVGAAGPRLAGPPAGRLTQRELQVLRLMATSHGYREIAAELVVSEETVRTHVKRILRKLQQPDSTRAVVAAVAAGILDVRDCLVVAPAPLRSEGSGADD